MHRKIGFLHKRGRPDIPTGRMKVHLTLQVFSWSSVLPTRTTTTNVTAWGLTFVGNPMKFSYGYEEMNDQGYKKLKLIYHSEGSLLDWNESGFPVLRFHTAHLRRQRSKGRHLRESVTKNVNRKHCLFLHTPRNCETASDFFCLKRMILWTN